MGLLASLFSGIERIHNCSDFDPPHSQMKRFEKLCRRPSTCRASSLIKLASIAKDCSWVFRPVTAKSEPMNNLNRHFAPRLRVTFNLSIITFLIRPTQLGKMGASAREFFFPGPGPKGPRFGGRAKAERRDDLLGSGRGRRTARQVYMGVN